MSMGSAAPAGAVDNIVARIERLPTSWWHVKTRIIVGVATFFDAFDAIAIATVLPVLVPMWKLTGPDIGFMISAGYVGQLIGARGRNRRDSESSGHEAEFKRFR